MNASLMVGRGGTEGLRIPSLERLTPNKSSANRGRGEVGLRTEDAEERERDNQGREREIDDQGWKGEGVQVNASLMVGCRELEAFCAPSLEGLTPDKSSAN